MVNKQQVVKRAAELQALAGALGMASEFMAGAAEEMGALIGQMESTAQNLQEANEELKALKAEAEKAKTPKEPSKKGGKNATTKQQ